MKHKDVFANETVTSLVFIDGRKPPAEL